MSKFVLSLSGGLDSTVLLAHLKDKLPESEAHTVSFFYGSKHNAEENWASAKIADYYKTSHRQIDLSGAFRGIESALMIGGGKLPEGHYEEESMKQTVVPGRNTVFAAVLLGLAQTIKADFVCLGIHAGDRAIYPDCRPLWRALMNDVMKEATDGVVRLEAPFISLTKKDIVGRGLELKVPFELTRTCYSSHAVACGVCGSCCERREAFDLNGAVDPIPYRNAGPLPKKPA